MDFSDEIFRSSNLCSSLSDDVVGSAAVEVARKVIHRGLELTSRGEAKTVNLGYTVP